MTNPMKPDTSPNSLSSAPAAGRRLNQLPVYLLGTVVVAVILVLATVVRARANQQLQIGDAASPTGIESPKPTSVLPEIADPQAPALIPPRSGLDPLSKRLLIAEVTDPDQPPVPPRSQSGATSSPIDPPSMDYPISNEDRDEAKRRRREQLMAALDSPLSADSSQSARPAVDVSTQISTQVLSPNVDLAAIEKGLAGLSGPPSSAPSRPGYEQFDRKQPGDRFALDSKVQAPRTPYELTAGFVLPATMITGINSDLPGTILAQVSQNVYDSATGNYLLVPQGSRLYGAYSSDVIFGQSRVLVAWQRIVFPDGKTMDIGAMPGADAAGMAGFKDQVNNYYLRIYANAFLLSGITAGITYSQRRDDSSSDNNGRDAGSTISEALGAQLGQVTAQLLAKNINVSPTLEIRPGYRFNVIVTKDLEFPRPYQAFDYRVRQQGGR